MEVSRDQLLECLSVPRWADDVLADAPYDDRGALLARADEAARTLTDDELAQALAGHPRIGERPAAGHNAAASAREQAGVVSTGSTEVTERLAAGNAAYERRFDRVFLIRAAGRTADQMLAELERRLRNDDDAERAETVDNLRQIAMLRLEGMVAMASLSTHVLDTAVGRPAAGIPVQLLDASGARLATGITDDDGRVASLADGLTAGPYTLRFDVATYQPRGFYPEVMVTFTVAEDQGHYHVPLLLSPYGYSTYRGS